MIFFFRDLQPKFGIKYSRDHIRRLVRTDKFPKPAGKLNDAPNAEPFWTLEQLTGFVNARIAAGLGPLERALAELNQENG
jgi:hypothetical protein